MSVGRARRSVFLVGGASLACAACAYVGVRERPHYVEAGTPVRCTESYWLVAADGAAIAGVAAAAVALSNKAEQDLEEAHARGEYDAQDGLAIVFPYFYGAAAASLLAASAVVGGLQIRDCRGARAWASATPAPASSTGGLDQPCWPVYELADRCDPGLYCARDRQLMQGRRRATGVRAPARAG